MYQQFMLVGARLMRRYDVDPAITSVPAKPKAPARPAPKNAEHP